MKIGMGSFFLLLLYRFLLVTLSVKWLRYKSVLNQIKRCWRVDSICTTCVSTSQILHFSLLQPPSLQSWKDFSLPCHLWNESRYCELNLLHIINMYNNSEFLLFFFLKMYSQNKNWDLVKRKSICHKWLSTNQHVVHMLTAESALGADERPWRATGGSTPTIWGL